MLGEKMYAQRWGLLLKVVNDKIRVSVGAFLIRLGAPNKVSGRYEVKKVAWNHLLYKIVLS
jgi:hypothetical protein